MKDGFQGIVLKRIVISLLQFRTELFEYIYLILSEFTDELSAEEILYIEDMHYIN